MSTKKNILNFNMLEKLHVLILYHESKNSTCMCKNTLLKNILKQKKTKVIKRPISVLREILCNIFVSNFKKHFQIIFVDNTVELTLLDFYIIYLLSANNSYLSFVSCLKEGEKIDNKRRQHYRVKDIEIFFTKVYSTRKNYIFQTKKLDEEADKNAEIHLLKDVCKTNKFSRYISVCNNREIIENIKSASSYALRNNLGKRSIIEISNILSRKRGNIDPKKIKSNCDISGLVWNRNSCYIDSVLICLLAVPSLFNRYLLGINLSEITLLDNNICGTTPEQDLTVRTELQDELKIITHNIRKGIKYSADTLRNIIHKCKLRADQRFWENRPQDAGEFTSWLLTRFPVEMGIIKTNTYMTNSLTQTNIRNMTLTSTLFIENQNPVYDISYFILKDANISSFLKEKDDSGELDEPYLYKSENTSYSFKRRITLKEYLLAPGIIIFNLQRKGLVIEEEDEEEDINTSLVKLTPQIKLKTGQIFELSGIVIYVDAAHYVSYYKCDKKWYYYDDMDDNTPTLESNDDETFLNDTNHGWIYTRSTLIFYNQIVGPRGLPQLTI